MRVVFLSQKLGGIKAAEEFLDFEFGYSKEALEKIDSVKAIRLRKKNSKVLYVEVERIM